MLDDHSLKIVFIIVVVVVCTSEQIFLLQCPEQGFITHFITNFTRQGTCDVTIKVIWFDKKTDFYFDGLLWEYLNLSVCIWYEDSFTQIKRLWSDSQNSSGDVVHVFMSSLRRHARFSVSVLKENAHLCHPFMHKYDCALWVNAHQTT